MTDKQLAPPSKPVTLASLGRGILPLLKSAPRVLRGARLLRLRDSSVRMSIGSVLERNAARYPDAPALLFEDTRLTHAQFNAAANRYANYLHAQGIRQGDVVGILVENRPAFLLLVAGIVKLGAIASIYNTRLRGDALAHCINIALPRDLIVGEECRQALDEVRGQLDLSPQARIWHCPDGGKTKVPEDSVDIDTASIDFDPDNPPQTQHVEIGAACFYTFTSGTTGLPKAAIVTHFRWLKSMAGFGYITVAVRPNESIYITLPFYHNTALTVGWSSAAALGGAVAMRRRFSVSEFWNDIHRYRANAFVYIGELCRFLLNRPPSELEHGHSVTRVVGNGLNPALWSTFKQRFGIDTVYELYGASEANIAFFNVFNQDATIGYCPASFAIVKCDPQTAEALPGPDGFLQRVRKGEAGLLLGQVTRDYPYSGYTDPAASETKLLRNVFAPGDRWFNSGDLVRDIGYRHAQFVDRLGDTYRWRGENVSTTEVEAIAKRHDAIVEAASYGVKIPGVEGRAGMLAIRVDADPARSLAEISEHLRQGLPEYALPVFLRFASHIDLTSTFKVMKVKLRAEGYDPEAVSDAMYFRLPRSLDFVPLDRQAYLALQNGELDY